jgi:light-regulated signal transduction histidine kinase (bacteriophytochrome)
VASEGGSINLGLVEYSNHMVAGTYECSVHHIIDNYIYVMLRNVTELEQAKTELELKNEELNQFTGIVSNDLKEPLNTVSGIVNLIQDEYHDKLDDQAKTLFKYLTDAAARMGNVITNLLDYSNLGHGHDMVTVDCNEIVKSVLQDLDAKIKTTAASLHFGDLPKILGFETELRLLFQNFISNSIKFSRPGITPIINISAKLEGDWVFSIKDNGIGISDKDKDKVFTIFQRLHSSDKYEGSGIGLAHCKKIVSLHKGKLWLESKPGEGSTFYFTIPNATIEN